MAFKNFSPVKVGVVDSGGSVQYLYMEEDAGGKYPVQSIYRGGPAQEPVRQFLDTVGDGSGTTNAAANYSVSAEQYRLTPANGVVYRVHTLSIMILGGSGLALEANKYLDVSLLANGVSVGTWSGDGSTLQKDLLSGLSVKQNSDWDAVGSLTEERLWGSKSSLLVKIPFTELMGEPLRLDGSSDEELIVDLNDDFSGLTNHYFFASGYVE